MLGASEEAVLTLRAGLAEGARIGLSAHVISAAQQNRAALEQPAIGAALPWSAERLEPSCRLAGPLREALAREVISGERVERAHERLLADDVAAASERGDAV